MSPRGRAFQRTLCGMVCLVSHFGSEIDVILETRHDCGGHVERQKGAAV